MKQWRKTSLAFLRPGALGRTLGKTFATCFASVPAGMLAIVLVGCLAGSNIGFGQPADNSPRYWFLDKLAATDLVAADWKLLHQNLQLALYELGDGESVGWAEPESGHSGGVRVISTVTGSDRVCRRVRVSVDVDAGSDDGIFELCRSGATGFWILTTNAFALHN